jgi:hypothetical protein
MSSLFSGSAPYDAGTAAAPRRKRAFRRAFIRPGGWIRWPSKGPAGRTRSFGRTVG